MRLEPRDNACVCGLRSYLEAPSTILRVVDPGREQAEAKPRTQRGPTRSGTPGQEENQVVDRDSLRGTAEVGGLTSRTLRREHDDAEGTCHHSIPHNTSMPLILPGSAGRFARQLLNKKRGRTRFTRRP